jgi:hypothetical protein
MIDAIVRSLCEHHPISAVALAGSRTGPYSSPASDWDLYVYSSERVPLLLRETLASRFAREAEVGNTFFEEGDELILRDGTALDVMYRSPSWIEAELSSVWDRAEARVGYTTAFVHNVRSSTILYDRDGWYATLKESVSGPYPAALKAAIIAKNYPLLRSKLTASYSEQIEQAVERGDTVSIVHRTAALLASYFDVLFALNELPHPGEKRQVRWATAMCPLLPPRFEAEIEAVCTSCGNDRLGAVHRLLDSLDEIL